MDFVELAWIPLVLGPKLLTGKMEQHGTGMLFHAMTSAAKSESVVCWLRLGWKPSPFKAELLIVLKREKRGSRAALFVASISRVANWRGDCAMFSRFISGAE